MAENPRERDETSSDEDDAARSDATKKKKKRKSKSSASEMIKFLKEFKEDKQKEEKEKLAALNKMHKEKNGCNESVPQHTFKEGRLPELSLRFVVSTGLPVAAYNI